ncbi:MAG: HNH endonuclease [Cytobacillus gottheilii]|uniref:HNH endonuclease n=1 Tax=Cytobacillus gottheilii TaxID=859144 RepID=UPI0034642B7D
MKILQNYKSLFKMPNPVKITGRSSSITNAFVNGIIPCIEPSESEIKEVLSMLGMTDSIRCSYCGDTYSEWDHFRPLIHKRRPTGYISEINNLVPTCGKCNQSKGNKYWKDWILSDAPLSPKTRNVSHLDLIIARLENYEAWSKPITINFEEVIDKELWEEHWANWETLLNYMKKSQLLSDQIQETLKQSVQQGASTITYIKPPTDQRDIPVLEEKVERKIGVIVRDELIDILVSNQLPLEKIQLLQTSKYSKQQLNLNFPMLLEVDETKDLQLQKLDARGYSRYYKKPIRIYGKLYFLCSQWYENSRAHLLRWIEWNKVR